MRLDDFLSTVGLVKRRTVAKELATGGLIQVNGRRVKPAYQVKVHDVILIGGNRRVAAEVLDIPRGSVPRAERARYVRELARD